MKCAGGGRISISVRISVGLILKIHVMQAEYVFCNLPVYMLVCQYVGLVVHTTQAPGLKNDRDLRFGPHSRLHRYAILHI